MGNFQRNGLMYSKDPNRRTTLARNVDEVLKILQIGKYRNEGPLWIQIVHPKFENAKCQNTFADVLDRR